MNHSFETIEFQLAAKLTVVLAVVWTAHAAFKSINPRWRVWTWRLGAVCAAVLLVAALLPPQYAVPVLPAAEPTPSLVILRTAEPADAEPPTADLN
ncbi:MAG: hypothetical protein ACRC1K_03195, partial [Planctomycetia bacterium]